MQIEFVIDASAWIEYLQGTNKGKKIAGIIEKEENICFTAASAVAEIISKSTKLNLDCNMALKAISNLSTIYDITHEIAISAGQIHSSAKQHNKDFGMLDAFAIAIARKLKTKLLTSDYDFKQFKEAVIIE